MTDVTGQPITRQLKSLSRSLSTLIEQRDGYHQTRFYNEFKRALLDHFKSAAQLPDDLEAALEPLNPPRATRKGAEVNQQVAAEINESRAVMLPYAEEKPSLPFGILSTGRYARVKKLTFPSQWLGGGFFAPSPAPRQTDTIITQEKKRDKDGESIHICFTALSSDPREWIETFARNVEAEITGNRHRMSYWIPIHFYIHLPPEFQEKKEEFMKVEMDQAENGSYSNPRFTPLDTIPAGLHRSLIEAGYRDSSCERAFEAHNIWRDFALESHKAALPEARQPA